MHIFVFIPADSPTNISFELREHIATHNHSLTVVPICSDSIRGQDGLLTVLQDMTGSSSEQITTPYKVFLCGIGRQGVALAHLTATEHPDKVAGVLLCPGESGLGAVLDIESLEETESALQPHHKSEALYTMVEVRRTGDNNQISSRADDLFIQGQGSLIIPGECISITSESGLDDIINHHAFYSVLCHAADDAAVVCSC